MSHVGTLIKENRERLLMTQATLARRLKVSRAFICRIESGDVGLPKKKYRVVAKKLRLEKSELRKAVVKDAETKIRTSI